MPRRSLTGEELPPRLPATAAGLAEQTLAGSARRFDPAALTRIGERLLACLDPDGPEPAEEPERTRELRVRTGSEMRWWRR